MTPQSKRADRRRDEGRSGAQSPAEARHRPPRAEYKVRARVWRYPGAAGWHFANLSPRQSSEIRARFSEDSPGWGSVPVTVRIGETVWHTSLFPDRKSGTYLFPIKAAVRKQHGIAAGDTISGVVHVR